MTEQIAIEVNRLRLRARHGVMEQERIVGNEFEVTVRLVYPAAEAVESDRLDATVNYAEVVSIVRSVMDTPSALLERVCGRLRDALCEAYPLIIKGTIKIAKLNPPIPSAQMESAAVELSWDKL